jgi:hypothetical protein
MQIRDGKNSDPGSETNIRDPQHWPVAAPSPLPLLHLSAEDGEAAAGPLLLADVEPDPDQPKMLDPDPH